MIGGQRLRGEYIESRAAEPAGAQRVRQRRLVDHRAARGVHEDGRGLHPVEGLPTDEAARLRRQREVDRQEIRFGETGFEVHPADALAATNDDPKLFVWTADPDTVIAIRRARRVLINLGARPWSCAAMSMSAALIG